MILCKNQQRSSETYYGTRSKMAEEFTSSGASSPIQWTWTWANSGRWWGTGKSGVLQFMGSQRVRHNLATEQQPQGHSSRKSLGHYPQGKGEDGFWVWTSLYTERWLERMGTSSSSTGLGASAAALSSTGASSYQWPSRSVVSLNWDVL